MVFVLMQTHLLVMKLVAAFVAIVGCLLATSFTVLTSCPSDVLMNSDIFKPIITEHTSTIKYLTYAFTILMSAFNTTNIDLQNNLFQSHEIFGYHPG